MRWGLKQKVLLETNKADRKAREANYREGEGDFTGSESDLQKKGSEKVTKPAKRRTLRGDRLQSGPQRSVLRRELKVDECEGSTDSSLG